MSPELRRQYNRAYYNRNRIKLLAPRRARYRRNPERKREQVKQFRERNPKWYREMTIRLSRRYKESHPAYVKKWARWQRENRDVINRREREHYAVDPEKHRAKYRMRRVRVRPAAGSRFLEQWLARVAYYGWRRFYCTKPLTVETLSPDHRIPIARGGSHWASNLVPSCVSCNKAKGARKIVRREFEEPE